MLRVQYRRNRHMTFLYKLCSRINYPGYKLKNYINILMILTWYISLTPEFVKGEFNPESPCSLEEFSSKQALSFHSSMQGENSYRLEEKIFFVEISTWSCCMSPQHFKGALLDHNRFENLKTFNMQILQCSRYRMQVHLSYYFTGLTSSFPNLTSTKTAKLIWHGRGLSCKGFLFLMGFKPPFPACNTHILEWALTRLISFKLGILHISGCIRNSSLPCVLNMILALPMQDSHLTCLFLPE